MNVRSSALSLLSGLEAQGQYSNIALDTEIRRKGFDGADRALLTALVYGTVERKITLDYVIDGLSSIPPSKIEKATRNILRMGIYQLAYMDKIPDHAAINESVELAGKRSKGFVNALLRAFVRTDKQIPLPQRENGTAEYFSVKYSVSPDVCKLLLDGIGEENTEKMLAAAENHPPMTLRTNTLKISRDELAERLLRGGAKGSETEFSPFGIKISDADGYSSLVGENDEGLFFVQDEVSQICALVTGAKKGDTVIDACACPGGKSFSMAMMMENEGVIKSFDLHGNKLSLIRNGAKRLGINIIEAAARDGRKFDAELEESADVLLLDVPCSGLGVMAKKPEIRYKNAADIKRLPEIQLEIVLNCIKYLKKGGTLVYSTCTVLPEENERNVERLLALHPEMKPAPFSVCGIAAENGTYTFLPSSDGSDGFFIAKLIKT